MKGRSSMAFGVFLVLVVLAMWEVKMVGAAPRAAQCHEESALAVKACMPVVFGKRPSPQCCQRARVSHVECICPVITPKLSATIDINRAIRLIEGCGRKVPRHFKCGSTTTPRKLGFTQLLHFSGYKSKSGPALGQGS